MYSNVIHKYIKYVFFFRFLSIIIYYGGGGLVAKLCPTLATPWTVARSSVNGIFQARILEWFAISFLLRDSNNLAAHMIPSCRY